MAEIQNLSANARKKGVKRLIKKSTRVDLTPMVDLGFLLITFFVFTSELSKPKVMDIISPVDTTEPTPVCESCVLTLILEKDNKIAYYEGMQENNHSLQETSFSTEGIRRLLLQKKEEVKKSVGDEKRMVLIIKPSNGSVYKNFVDILDEVKINDIQRYFIDELNEQDKKLVHQP